MKPLMKRSKFLSLIIVAVMIVSMTAVLLIHAGAVNANMSVASYSVVNNSPMLTSLDAGQVWTGKNVSETDVFGDGPNGQFTVTLSAIGCVPNAGASPVDAAGLTFDDTFTAEYAFVAPDSQMIFYLDGTAHTVGLAGGVYQYLEGAGSNLVEVTFNPASNTVRYFIGQNALKTTTPGAVSGAEVYNTLVFGVRLTEEVETVGTPYNTNLTNSCTARYNTVQTRSEYVGGSSTNTYRRSEGELRWEVLTDVHNEAHFAGGIDKLEWINLFVGPNTYRFTRADGEIGFDPDTAGVSGQLEYNWSIWIIAGTYVKQDQDGNYHTLRISNPADPKGEDRLLINAKRTRNEEIGQYIAQNSIISGIVEEGFAIVGTDEFYIIKEPTDADPTAVVTAGSTTYTGAVNTPVSSSWSFTDTSKNAVVNLVDANTLTVTTSTSYMTSTTETVPVTQIHDDYGIVMLEANQVAGDVTKEPEASVAGDSDEELPQTGGISNSTLIGIFGLALISIGGTAFIIYRKKFLN